jgi:hypothetical protein
MDGFPSLFNTGSNAPSMGSPYGFNPTPGEHIRAMQAQEANTQLLQRAAMMDPQANAAVGLMANRIMFPGDPRLAQEWMKTQEGQASQQVASLFLSQTGIGGLGKSADMITGIQNMVANAGMGVGMPGVAGAQQFFGSGFLTDQLSLGLMGQMTSDFYKGGQKTFEARGLNMSDVGQIMNSGAARGMFAGSRMYDMEAYTPETIQADLEKAVAEGDLGMTEALKNAEPGQMRLRLNEESKRVKKFVQDTGELLGDLKNIYPGKAVEELLQIAETVTGMGIEEMGGPQATRARINRVSNMAQAYGLNPEAVLQANAQLNQGIAGQLSSTYGMSPEMYRRTSAALGAVGTETMIAARQSGMEGVNILGQNGVVQRQFSDEYRASVAGSSSLAIMEQEYAAVEALYAADQVGTSAADKQALRSAVTELQGAGTEEERQAVRTKISSIMEKSGFGPSGTLRSAFGGDLTRMTERMSGSSLDKLGKFTQQFDRKAALEYQVADSVDTTRLFERNKEFEKFGRENVTSTFSDLIGGFNQATLDDIIKEKDPAKRKQLMIAAGMDEGAASQLAKQVTDLDSTGKFADAFREFQGDFMSNPKNANFFSDQAMRDADERSYQTQAINTSLGRHRLGKAGMFESFLAGVTGTGEGVTEENVMAYMHDKFKSGEGRMGTLLSRNAAGGFDVSRSKADEMLKNMTGGDAKKRTELMDKLGVSSEAELAEKLKTKEGANEFHKLIMQDTSLLGNLTDTEGTLFVGNKDQYEATKSQMESLASEQFLGALGANDFSKEMRDKIASGDPNAVAELHKVMMSKDASGLSSSGQDVLDAALGGDEEKMQAMLAYGSERMGGRGVILEELNKRQAELKEQREGAWTDKGRAGIDKEMQKINAMKEQLGAGPGEGKKYLGVMSLVDSGGEPVSELSVYQE